MILQKSQYLFFALLHYYKTLLSYLIFGYIRKYETGSSSHTHLTCPGWQQGHQGPRNPRFKLIWHRIRSHCHPHQYLTQTGHCCSKSGRTSLNLSSSESNLGSDQPASIRKILWDPNHILILTFTHLLLMIRHSRWKIVLINVTRYPTAIVTTPTWPSVMRYVYTLICPKGWSCNEWAPKWITWVSRLKLSMLLQRSPWQDPTKLFQPAEHGPKEAFPNGIFFQHRSRLLNSQLEQVLPSLFITLSNSSIVVVLVTL